MSAKLESRWSWLTIWGPTVLLSLLGFALAWWFVEPAPPGAITFASGAPGGAYHAFAEQYATEFADRGVGVTLLETAGSVENIEKLLAGEADLAFVQGGTVRAEHREQLVALADVYAEPVMLFLRGIPAADFELSRLEGRRVAVGMPGSGTRPIATALLDAVGVNAERVDLGSSDATQALIDGELDAAFFVLSPDGPTVSKLLSSPGIELADFRRAEALAGRFRFLRPITLHEGAVDLAADLPRRDTRLVAPAAVLMASADTHSGIATLGIYAATSIHGKGDALDPPGTYPRRSVGDVAMSDAADYALRNGPNFLHRRLPFWAASLIDRLLILMLPLLGLLIPLLRIAPPTYRWRVRRRIYRWYKRLNDISQQLRHDADLDKLRADVAELDREIARVNVPLSYMDELYDLRLHVQFLERRLEKAARDPSGTLPA
ncbi:MAG: TAXI family TRAP transporter solute-binding subunit [Planctomycetota bacterium]